MWRKFLIIALPAIAAAAQLGGCYYMQAVGGQFELLRKRQPIEKVLDEPGLDPAVRDKLELVLEARRFATDELGLPDNGSYQSYADLERDFVVWNVFATPEFELAPVEWCYPVVGCLAYRGYFSEAAAKTQAAKLEEQGFDVYVGGVPAYSTLGRFEDPVLNTMMRWSNADLVNTLFHELAHQRLFVKGDTGFNESFATAVADIGIERWMRERPDTIDVENRRQREALRADMVALAEEARRHLERLYASPASAAEKREQKKARLAQLSTDATALANDRGYRSAGWLGPPLNNARLLSVALYQGNNAAFRAMFDECGAQLACFYERAEQLAALQPAEREAALEALAPVAAPGAAGY